MPHRNTLDPDQVSGQARRTPSIGPSDSSDSGSDLAGLEDFDGDDSSDRSGTGDRPSVELGSDVLPDSDIEPDRIVGPEEVGLGGGLDQAEEAQLGITDEELDDELKEGMRRR